MPAFENADAPLASGAPFLTLLEPTLLLPLLARNALGGVAGNRDWLHSLLLSLGFIRGREETRIGRHQLGDALKPWDVLFQSRYQSGGVGGPLIIDLVVGDDLVLGFLDLDQLAELIGLIGFSLADHFCVCFKQAQEFALGVSVASEDS